jgi:FkbM family methyltransferase
MELLRIRQALASLARELRRGLAAHWRASLTQAARALAYYEPPAEEEFLVVGARRGRLASEIRKRRPAAKIVCFEPWLERFPGLERRIGWDGGARLYCCGLGAKDERRKVYTRSSKGYLLEGLASTLTGETQDWPGPGRLYLLRVQEETFRIRRLDDLSLRPCFMAIDADGAALDVLLGGERTIGAHRPVILFEAPPADRELAVLRPLGYRSFRYDGLRLLAGPGTDKGAFLIPERRLDQFPVDFVDCAAPPSPRRARPPRTPRRWGSPALGAGW